MIEQRRQAPALQPWILSRAGHVLDGQDHDRRLAEMRAGLLRHEAVRPVDASADEHELHDTLSTLHDADYLRVLEGLTSEEPVLMPEFAAPGMAADTPVCASVARAAYEGVRTAIDAARQLTDGERFAYALCRPPGHHAGPGWLGGCCYLNNAAAAAHTLHRAGLGPVAILDLDIHYPNGTAAIAARMSDTTLHSLHSWPVVNVPSQSALPCSGCEHVVEFRSAPDAEHYLDALADTLEQLSSSAAAIVLSLGYDTLAGDPHGCWSFAPDVYVAVGALLRDSRLPVCVVQEGGYALGSLADCSHAFASGLLDGEAR